MEKRDKNIFLESTGHKWLKISWKLTCWTAWEVTHLCCTPTTAKPLSPYLVHFLFIHDAKLKASSELNRWFEVLSWFDFGIFCIMCQPNNNPQMAPKIYKCLKCAKAMAISPWLLSTWLTVTETAQWDVETCLHQWRLVEGQPFCWGCGNAHLIIKSSQSRHFRCCHIYQAEGP